MSDRKPTRPPGLRVPSDTFTVVRDGVTYRPHAGEWVEFFGDGTVGDTLLMQRGERLSREVAAAGDGASDELQLRAERLTEEMCRRAAANIVAWTWTDRAGRPYPNPPAPADLEGLTWPELTYLISRGQAGGDERDPNAEDAGSTSFSPEKPEPAAAVAVVEPISVRRKRTRG